MEMVTIKTADLIGPALDWAAAKADGVELCGEACSNSCVVTESPICGRSNYRPSTDWSQGGPLLEKYLGGALLRVDGLLPNAIRAIVLDQLGEEVQVPAELVQQ